MAKKITQYSILTPERMIVWYGSEMFIISNDDGQSLLFEDLKAMAEEREKRLIEKTEKAKGKE